MASEACGKREALGQRSTFSNSAN